MGEQPADALVLAVQRELERLFAQLISGAAGKVTEPAPAPSGR